ncbi:hypothetical protein Tco_1455143 [Tanacetum coccineum]
MPFCVICPYNYVFPFNVLFNHVILLYVISVRNTNSPIDVHEDVEQLARATTAKLDRILVDLVRKEIKSLLDIIDYAEHRIESDTNVVEDNSLALLAALFLFGLNVAGAYYTSFAAASFDPHSQ